MRSQLNDLKNRGAQFLCLNIDANLVLPADVWGITGPASRHFFEQQKQKLTEDTLIKQDALLTLFKDFKLLVTNTFVTQTRAHTRLGHQDCSHETIIDYQAITNSLKHRTFVFNDERIHNSDHFLLKTTI